MKTSFSKEALDLKHKDGLKYQKIKIQSETKN
jgi:hypothetical protein